MRDDLAIVVVGLVAGLAIPLAATRLIRQVLFDVKPGDTTTYVAAILVILGTAIIACLAPWSAGARD